MKSLESLTFNPLLCRAELSELAEHLEENTVLHERKHVLPFFRERKHLSAFLGSYITYFSSFDRIAFEYDIFGDFKADLVVGDSQSGRYLFIEFEDASPNSIFDKKRGKSTLEWSPRFEHGFSQLIDWFWKLQDMQQTREFMNRFGHEMVDYYGMLVVGRMGDLEQKERDRLRWRRSRVLVDTTHIICITYDELLKDLDNRLRYSELAYLSEGGPGNDGSGSSGNGGE